MNQPTQTKKIKIISLDSKEFNGPNGLWIKYNIKAHDGQYYGSTDRNWFSKRKIGEVLVINYWSTVPAANKFGKMVSYNNVVSGEVTKASAPTSDLSDAIMGLVNLIKKSEANIIDAIRLHCGTDLKIDEPEQTFQEKLDDIPTVEDENNLEEEVTNPF